MSIFRVFLVRIQSECGKIRTIFTQCYFKRIWVSETTTKYREQTKYLPILHYCTITSSLLTLIPYSTFLRKKLCIKNKRVSKHYGFQNTLNVDNKIYSNIQESKSTFELFYLPIKFNYCKKKNF